MRYASIRSMDISNGENVGVALFVQGCHFHCDGCFNRETWDFNGGKEWTSEEKEKFLELIDRPYIRRVSILGGEPLAEENIDMVYWLLQEINENYPDKTIWLYTGYTWEQLFEDDNFGIEAEICKNQTRRAIVLSSDVLVDGQYIDSKRDITLKWKGSSNQRVIDIKKSLKQNKIVELI